MNIGIEQLWSTFKHSTNRFYLNTSYIFSINLSWALNASGWFWTYLHLTTTWMFFPFSSRLVPLEFCEAIAAEIMSSAKNPPDLWNKITQAKWLSALQEQHAS